MNHCPLLFFGANEIGNVHVYGKKKTHDRNGLSRSHLHYNGRRGVDHMYFVMPNQQYSQLQKNVPIVRIIFDSPTYIKIVQEKMTSKNCESSVKIEFNDSTPRSSTNL